jgi:hypothetical protein
MPRTLRQLWAEEDEAHEREVARRQRATRLRAKQCGRPRRSVVIHGTVYGRYQASMSQQPLATSGRLV